MTDRPLRVSTATLKTFVVSVFDRWGTPPAIADLTADLMVRTDLRGVDSHGVGMLPTYQRWYRRGWTHFLGAIDIARFRDLGAFKADMDDLLRALKDSPKAEGQNRIYVAGEPEWECEQRRRREGIPLAPGLVRQLREVSVEAGVSFTLGA